MREVRRTMHTVALLHGFTGSPASFGHVERRLGARSLRVEAPALLGHGADDVAVRDFEDEVERLARHLRALPAPVHLAGYSLGGRLAIGLLCRHPSIFSGATLISAQPGLTAATARSERRTSDETWCTLLETEGLDAFVEAWEALPLFATQATLPEDVRRAQRAERLAHSPSGLVRSLRVCGLGEMPPYWAALSAVRVPTTLVVGELDAKFAVIAEQMCEIIPGSALVVVPGAGHNVVLERPDAVADVIARAVAEDP
jgi:2-succinyl-6-hydroxy-2,4-cyclohexadiene-1-carboxylate synthase